MMVKGANACWRWACRGCLDPKQPAEERLGRSRMLSGRRVPPPTLQAESRDWLRSPSVLLISGNCPPTACGVGDYTYSLAAALSRAGMDVRFLTTTGQVPANGTRIAVKTSIRSWNLFRIAEAMKEVRAAKPDVVHLQYPTSAYGMGLLPQALVFSRRPFVVTIHEAHFSHILRRLSLYPFLIFADHVIATTHFEANYLAWMYPPVRKRLSVIQIGSNLPVAPVRPRDNRVVVYFGLIAPNKGLEDFIALAGLAKEVGEPWRFRIVGMPPKRRESYARKLRDASRTLPVEWCLNLPAEEVAEHLASAGAVYLPFPDGASSRRGSLVAALVNGAPTVTTYGEATPAELIGGENVVYANLPEVAREEIRRIFSNAFFSEKLSRGAVEYGESFSWPLIAKRHAVLYDRVAKGRA